MLGPPYVLCEFCPVIISGPHIAVSSRKLVGTSQSCIEKSISLRKSFISAEILWTPGALAWSRSGTRWEQRCSSPTGLAASIWWETKGLSCSGKWKELMGKGGKRAETAPCYARLHLKYQVGFQSLINIFSVSSVWNCPYRGVYDRS